MITLQSILGVMRRAVTDYRMISAGDRIAVGLSGGKDSLVLLKALAAYRRFSPEPFSLAAVTVDLGLGNIDFGPLAAFAEAENVPYRVEKTDIGEIVFGVRKEKNPCALCAKMRRGALNSAAKAMGCNKIALGHHADDLAETFLLSLFYEGRLSTFAPMSTMERSGITLIRPLLYAEEKDVAALAKALQLPVAKSPCPADRTTRREYMKDLIRAIRKDIPFAKDRMIAALTHPERDNLFGRGKDEFGRGKDE